MAVDVSKIPNNSKFDPVRVAILNLQGQIEDTGAAVGNGTLTINTSGDLLTGTGTFTANQSGDTTITIGVDGAEYISSISHNTSAQKLVITFGDGTTQEVNLAQYIDDTNLARITSGSVNSTTGVATFTRDDNTTFTVDFSGFLEADTLHSVTGRNNTTTNDISVGGIDLTYQNSDSKIRLESGAFTDSNDRYEILATGDVLMFQYYDDDQGDGTSVITSIMQAEKTKVTLYRDLNFKRYSSGTLVMDKDVLTIDTTNNVVNLENVNNGTFAGDLVVGTTNVYDNLPDGITYSTTDNRLKIGVSKNVGSTTETAIQPILLANLLTEGFVPYVATGGAGSSTVNSKVSDSWLKVTSTTLELGASDPVSHEVRYARFLWQSGQNDKISTVYGARDITASVQYSGGSATAKIAFTTGTGAGRIRFNNEYTFPAADGTSGQVLTTDGSGDLSWADSTGSGITDRLYLEGGATAKIGTTFWWRQDNSGNNGSTWRKVCDVAIPTGTWKALSMDITYYYPASNHGASASLLTKKYSASFRRSDGTQDGYDDAILYGDDVYKVRIMKTATGAYELQARAYTNNQAAAVKYVVTGGDDSWITPATSIVAGATTGTEYTASPNSATDLELAGDIVAKALYDADNTGYYIDPDSTSILNDVTLDTVTIDGILLQDSADRAGLLEVNRKGTNTWSGIQVNYGDNHWSWMGNTNYAGLYDDKNGKWVYLYSTNNHLELYYNGTAEARTQNGYFLAVNEFRSAVFRGTNTAYHVTPAGTSELNSLSLGGNLYGYWIYLDKASNNNGIHIYAASGGKLNWDARDFSINSDTGARIHKWNRNTADTVYLPYYENWYDGNSYHTIGVENDNFYIDGNKILTTADEGSGNGLDADTVDGLQASQFLRSDADDTMSGKLTFAKGSSGTLASRTGYSDFIGYNPSYGSYIGGRANNAAGYLYAGGYYNDGSTVHTLIHSGNHTSYTDNKYLRSDTSDTMSGDLTINPSTNYALYIGRMSGQPNIKSSDSYAFMDSNGGHAGLNWYTSDNVTLANGGGSVGIGNSSISQKLTVHGTVGATVYYDKDNTGYYADPASTSNFSRLDLQAYSFFNSGLQVKRNIGTTSPSWQDANHTFSLENSDAGYISINFHRAGYTSNNIYYTGSEIITDDTFRSTVDMRAPIFYDSDNTSYYINPAGLSYVNEIRSNEAQANPRYDTAFYVLQAQHWYGDNSSQGMYLGESGNDVYIRGQVAIGGTAIQSGYALTMTGSIDMNASDINYVSQLHFNDNVRFYDDGNDNYLNFKYGDANYGAIVFWNGGGTRKGYIYADNSGFGLLDNDGSWAVRTQTGTNPLELRCDNNVEFQVFNSYTLSPGSSRAPIFYDSNNTGYYIHGDSTSRLNLLNVNATGTSVAGVGKVMFPYGAEYNSGSTTGAIKITLPQSWTNTMMTMKITIFDYSINESIEVHCGGYNYAGGGGSWVNTHAKIIANPHIDRNYNVRFGHDGSKCCILIGETNTAWSYPKVVVTEWVGGHSNETFSNWDNGWAISIVTTLPSNIDQTRSDNQIGRTTDSLQLPYYNGGTMYLRKNSHWDSVSGIDVIGGAGEFRFSSNSGNLNVRADGWIHAHDNMKSPIFYDSNNTGYYIHGDSTSRLYNLNVTHFGVVNTSQTSRDGISLYGGYSGGEPTYGILFSGTTGFGGHGAVTSDWATYFTMNNNNSRGWIFRRVGSGNCASISGGGTASFNGDVVAYYSDMRLKTKLGDIKDPIGKIQALNGFYYEPNEVAESYGYEKETRVGLSAQEVEAVLPEIVTDAPIGDGYKTVDYAKLVPVLVEAIKEQQKQIDELKSLINKS